MSPRYKGKHCVRLCRKKWRFVRIHEISFNRTIRYIILYLLLRVYVYMMYIEMRLCYDESITCVLKEKKLYFSFYTTANDHRFSHRYTGGGGVIYIIYKRTRQTSAAPVIYNKKRRRERYFIKEKLRYNDDRFLIASVHCAVFYYMVYLYRI